MSNGSDNGKMRCQITTLRMRTSAPATNVSRTLIEGTRLSTSEHIWEFMSESGQDAWVETPWGRYSIVHSGPGYQVKSLIVYPGQELSLQLHRRRSEHWIAVSGSGRAHVNGRTCEMGIGDQLSVPVGTKHRLGNPNAEPFEIVEIQFGDYLGEDDIKRFEDRYGRS
jgi:mannose-1-phosphate guanylyltransferase/mannose-6-phosphate isomerase